MSFFRITSAVSVDKGKVRSNNEDNFYFNGISLNKITREESVVLCKSGYSDKCLYAVCDGMGGEDYGEEASLLAAESCANLKKSLSAGTDVDKALDNYISDVNSGICRLNSDHGSVTMGTTIAGVYIDGRHVTVFNIGDSRVYLLRGSVLTQLTADDTLAQSLVNRGYITREGARTHKNKNMLTQYLGCSTEKNESVEAHIQEEIKIRKNDKFLICSDGLTDMLDEESICDIMTQSITAEEICDVLVGAALDKGGTDNITCMVITADDEMISINRAIVQIIMGAGVLFLILILTVLFIVSPDQIVALFKFIFG